MHVGGMCVLTLTIGNLDPPVPSVFSPGLPFTA